MTPEVILALMIAFAQPGQSVYSQTVVAADDGRACDNKMSLLCAEPKANAAWGNQFTRPETHAEGLVRYGQIARIVHEVAEASTWLPVKNCPPPRVVRWQKTSDRCKALHKSRPWPGTADELKRYMLTVVAHESGFRLDVMSGRGNWSKGDCKDPKRPGTCRSICLGQVLKTRRNWKSQRGYSWRSLAGTDDAAVTRCLRTVSDYLGTAKAVCTSDYGPVATGPRCVYSTYGGVTSSNHPGITARVRTHQRFGRPPRAGLALKVATR